MAFRYALARNLRSLTLVHKGNIMKFTERGFRDWGYEVAREKFADCAATESDFSKGGTAARADAIVVKDRIADAMLQQLLLRPTECSVIAAPNLTGDYLSGVMMLEYTGWPEAAQLIVRGLENAIKSKRVTYNLARQMPGAREVWTSAFGDQVIRGMPA
jgi:isocitrate dehydrogenase